MALFWAFSSQRCVLQMLDAKSVKQICNAHKMQLGLGRVFNFLLMYLFMHCKAFGPLAAVEAWDILAMGHGGWRMEDGECDTIRCAAMRCDALRCAPHSFGYANLFNAHNLKSSQQTTSGFLATSKSTRRMLASGIWLPAGHAPYSRMGVAVGDCGGLWVAFSASAQNYATICANK